MAQPIAVLCSGPFWCPKCRGYIRSLPVDFGPPRNVRWVNVCGCKPDLLMAYVEDEAERARTGPHATVQEGGREGWQR